MIRGRSHPSLTRWQLRARWSEGYATSEIGRSQSTTSAPNGAQPQDEAAGRAGVALMALVVAREEAADPGQP